MIVIYVEPGDSQEPHGHEERKSSGYPSELPQITPTVMPQKVAYIRLRPGGIPFVKGEVMLKLGGHNSKIMDPVSVFPRTLEIQSIDLVIVKDIIYRVGIAMYSATGLFIQHRVAPPISKKFIVHKP
jgi:hypothetical protein